MPWIDMLRAEVARYGQAATAQRIGYSPTALSQVLSGKYGGNLANIETAVVAALGSVDCPWLEKDIEMPDCRANRERGIPKNKTDDLKFWRACQSCTAWCADAVNGNGKGGQS